MLPLTVEKTSDKAPTTEMTAAEKATTLYNTLKWPLIAYSLLAGLYMTTVGKNAGTWVWFSWHPLCMLVGFVAMAGNAALIKKIGGYENTKAHGIMMTIATVLTSFAWYVIYTNKEMYGKPHLISLHGKLGVGVMLSYFGLGAVGALGLHPDFGMLKTNKTLRLAHKVGGRIVTALAWACCVLGKFHNSWRFLNEAVYFTVVFCITCRILHNAVRPAAESCIRVTPTYFRVLRAPLRLCRNRLLTS
jgi:hypothetical protein